MKTDTDSFAFSRRYALAPARLWHLLTDPQMRSLWGAPSENMVLQVLSEDLRVGGIERHRCGPAEAPDFEVETRWYRLEAPEHAVFTETIEAGGARLGASLVTYRLAEGESGGSDLQISVAVSSFVGAGMIGDFRDGWTGGVENLDRLVAAQDAPA